MRRMFFTSAKDVDAPGAGHVARSSVDIIMMLLRVRGFLEQKIRTSSVVGVKRDSRKRTTVQEVTVATVIGAGRIHPPKPSYTYSPAWPRKTTDAPCVSILPMNEPIFLRIREISPRLLSSACAADIVSTPIVSVYDSMKGAINRVVLSAMNTFWKIIFAKASGV